MRSLSFPVVVVFLAAIAIAALRSLPASGAERERWGFKAVVLTGPSSARAEPPSSWVAHELDGLSEPMRPYLDDGWEPVDTTWLLGGSLLVTMKRRN